MKAGKKPKMNNQQAQLMQLQAMQSRMQAAQEEIEKKERSTLTYTMEQCFVDVAYCVIIACNDTIEGAKNNNTEGKQRKQSMGEW